MTNSENIKEYIQHTVDWKFLSSESVVVDCGHLPVYHSANGYVFGSHEGRPTEAQKTTLELGLFLFDYLKNNFKSVKMSLCFTDTTKFIKDPLNRIDLISKFESGEIFKILPEEYRELINKHSLGKEDFVFTLQTRNSNQFVNLLHKVKEKIKKIKDPREIFNHYNSMFLEDHKEIDFGFTHPFLLSFDKEDTALGGDWWRDDDFVPTHDDFVKAPFLRVKKLSIVKLYSKLEGVLCPSSYAGLLLNMPDHYDHIAIYSRADDESITEKIIRGAIANMVLKRDFNKNCLQIVFPKSGDKPELSYISREILESHRPTYEEFMERFSGSHLFEKFKTYL